MPAVSKIYSCLCCFVLCYVFLQSQLHGQPAGRHFQFLRLSEEAFAATPIEDGDASINCGIVITDSWVCVFDSSQSTEAAEELKAFITHRTHLPIRYLINSQYHGNHTHGNQVFDSSPIEILSSRQTRMDMNNKDLPQLQRYQQMLPESIERLKKEMRTMPPGAQAEELQAELTRREKMLLRLNSLRLTLPTVTFDSAISLHGKESEIHLSFLGKGNTAGDIVLWLTEPRILFAGDLVFSQSIPDLEDASIKDWIETLSILQKWKPEIVVPSVGKVTDDKIIDDSKQYLLDLRRSVQLRYERGESLETVLQANTLPEKYKDYRDTEFYPNNVEKAYREMQQESLVPVKSSPSAPPKR